MKNILDLIDLIQENLTEDLLRKPYKGHCYIASEAFYHLLGREKSGFTPMFVRHEGMPHWFLKRNNEIIDLTDYQFKTLIPYHRAIGKGFLTKKPSKRTKILIKRVKSDQ